jgi:hypothetical protein
VFTLPSRGTGLFPRGFFLENMRNRVRMPARAHNAASAPEADGRKAPMIMCSGMRNGRACACRIRGGQPPYAQARVSRRLAANTPGAS